MNDSREPQRKDDMKQWLLFVDDEFTIITNSGDKAVQLAIENENISHVRIVMNPGKRIDWIKEAEIILKDGGIPVVAVSGYTRAVVVQKTEWIIPCGCIEPLFVAVGHFVLTKTCGELIKTICTLLPSIHMPEQYSN